MKNIVFKNWLVVDDSPEDAERLKAAIVDLGGKVDVASTLKQAEQMLKNSFYDLCLIDCYFKGSEETGETLIPGLRESLPTLPVIMMSNSDDEALPPRMIEAGADVFVPKFRDHVALIKGLRAAASQARTIRSIQMRDLNAGLSVDLFLNPQTRMAVSAARARKDERLLIIGNTGTGKTSLANSFALSFVKFHYGESLRNIVYFDCAAEDKHTHLQSLAGEEKIQKDEWQFGIFERGQGGVVILDNVHALDKPARIWLQNALAQGSFKTKQGSVSFDNLKLVVTADLESSEDLLDGPFFEELDARVIVLPLIQKFKSQMTKLIQFLVERETEQHTTGIVKLTPKVLLDVEKIVRRRKWTTNFKGFTRFIRCAIENAAQQNRTQLFTIDFESVSFGEDLFVFKPTKDFTKFAEVLESSEGKKLLELISTGRNYEEAQSLLSKLMIDFSSLRNNNNKTHMSRALGIARQTVYKISENFY